MTWVSLCLSASPSREDAAATNAPVGEVRASGFVRVLGLTEVLGGIWQLRARSTIGSG